MSTDHQQQADIWADRIAAAYAAETVPPLTSDMVHRLRDQLAAALAGLLVERIPCERWGEYINPVLDEWEQKLNAVVGPRLAGADEQAGTVRTVERSEGGRPLRSFGGQ